MTVVPTDASRSSAGPAPAVGAVSAVNTEANPEATEVTAAVAVPEVAPGGVTPGGVAPGGVMLLPPRTKFLPAARAVCTGQLARARVARVPLLFVAAFQSLGIMVLLRGVVDAADTATASQVVAGSTVLVVAFVAVNLLAQRFGALRASGGLDYYLTLPIPRSAVVLGTAASYATFAVPGTVVTAVVGAALYDLPFASLWVLLPVVVLAGASLAGAGAAIGLLAPKPELATVAGQVGMSVILFLGIIPANRMPVVVVVLRGLLPSSYAADALAAAFQPGTDWTAVAADLLVCSGFAVVTLAVAAVALRRVNTGRAGR